MLAAFRASLLEGRPLRLQDYSALLQARFPELAALAYVREPAPRGERRTALMLTQELLGAVQPDLSGLSPPRAQALYLAALLAHVGQGAGAAASRYERGEAALARDVLFRLDLPDCLRDEVVYLVRSQRAPALLGARPASQGRMLRLAWTLDTELLYRLAVAEADIVAPAKADRTRAALDAFRARCQALGIYGSAPPPLLSEERWRPISQADPCRARRLQGELRFWRAKGTINTAEQAEAWLAGWEAASGGVLYLPVGVPGSGKSTWVGRHLSGAHLVSMDEMRERLLGNRSDQSRNAEVYRRSRGELLTALRRGEVVVWDAQSHTWSARQGLLLAARQTHAYVIIAYLDVPLTVALERNGQRTAVVPEAVIARSYNDLQEPRPFECEELWRIDVHGNTRFCQIRHSGIQSPSSAVT